MNGVADAAFVVAAAKHTGHRRDPQLFNVLTGVEMVVHLHDHLILFAVDHKFVRAGQARAIQQSVNSEGGIRGFRRFKPERGEVGKLFRRIGKGIDSHAARRKAVLICAVYRPEIAGPQEGNDIAARQLRRFKRAETGEAKIFLPFQLLSINPGVVVVE